MIGEKARNKMKKSSFSVGSFNVRRLIEHHSKKELARNTNRLMSVAYRSQISKMQAAMGLMAVLL